MRTLNLLDCDGRRRNRILLLTVFICLLICSVLAISLERWTKDLKQQIRVAEKISHQPLIIKRIMPVTKPNGAEQKLRSIKNRLFNLSPKTADSIILKKLVLSLKKSQIEGYALNLKLLEGYKLHLAQGDSCQIPKVTQLKEINNTTSTLYFKLNCGGDI